jgi:hypothetical protein
MSRPDDESDLQFGQYQGLKITVSEGRWRPVIRSIESQERALQGDNKLLGERLRGGYASRDEQRLAGDLLTDRVKPKKKKRSELLTEDRRQLISEFVLKAEKCERDNPSGLNRESFVQDAIERFKVVRSEIFTSLKRYEQK